MNDDYRLPPYWYSTRIMEIPQFDWSFESIGVQDAWKTSRGRDIRVAVLDTGVDLDHPDLFGQIELSRDFTGEGVNDQNGHGTWCAGCVAGKTWGRAPESKLLIAKVLNKRGSGSTRAIADGILWASGQGAHVISMSLAGGPDPNIHAAIKEAVASDCIVVCAAGNSGPGFTEYPAAYDECVSVGAFDRATRLAGFSSQNKQVDVAAPGVDVLSIAMGGGVTRMTGTSMACPQVAACAALVQGARRAANEPLLDALQFRGLIRNNSIDAGPPDFDTGFGWGIVAPEFLISVGDPLPKGWTK